MMVAFFHAFGRAVCHQMPERSLLVKGMVLPVCARCTGIYIGMTLTFLFFLFRKRLSSNQPPKLGQAIFLAVCLLPFMIDGAGSYLGLWETNNFIRLMTGISAGFSLPVFLVLVVQFQVEQENIRPILKNFSEILLLFSFEILTILCLYWDFGLYFVYAIFICIGIWMLVFSIFMIPLSIFLPKKEKKKLAVISFLMSFSVIGLISYLLGRV